jgi:hypothetical protein
MTIQKINEILNNEILINDNLSDIDYAVEEDGTIQVFDRKVGTAAQIARVLNTSKAFDKQVVRLGWKGDSIILGFDELVDAEAVYEDYIGPDCEVTAEVKQAKDGYYVYMDNRRTNVKHKSIAAAKRYITQLDNQLCDQVTAADTLDTD